MGLLNGLVIKNVGQRWIHTVTVGENRDDAEVGSAAEGAALGHWLIGELCSRSGLGFWGSGEVVCRSGYEQRLAARGRGDDASVQQPGGDTAERGKDRRLKTRQQQTKRWLRLRLKQGRQMYLGQRQAVSGGMLAVTEQRR